MSFINIFNNDISESSDSSDSSENISDNNLTSEQIFIIINKISISLKTNILLEGYELYNMLKILIDNAIPILSEYKNIVEIEIPKDGKIIIIGDTHGQKDLLALLEKNEKPSVNNKYLFLGDYVDRGNYSVENCLLLLCYINLYKENCITLRGNHECKYIYMVYGLFTEIQNKFNGLYIYKILELFDKFFSSLPLASIISNQNNDIKYFACHGGPAFIDRQTPATIDDINKINRFVIDPKDLLLLDILWSDPNEYITDNIESERGSGTFYSEIKLKEALTILGCNEIFRAHELCDGYMQKIKLCNTVFSCKNYAEVNINFGGFVILNDKLEKQIIIYDNLDDIDVNQNNDYLDEEFDDDGATIYYDSDCADL